MTFKVVTISNRRPAEWYYLYDAFYKSLGKRGAYLIDYSQDDPWKGLATKPKWLCRAIKEGRIPEELMIFCDSWDLVFGASPNEIIDKYKDFKSDIVISAERNCFPLDYKKAYDDLDIPTPYSYLNSGFIVGKTQSILTCLEAMDLSNVKDDHWDAENNRNYHSNDQTIWQSIFLQQPVKIALDYNQMLSQTLHDAKVEDFDFSGERIKNNITDSFPSTFHFNGGAKDNLSLRQPILKHLGL
jgi:hypothetical protein